MRSPLMQGEADSLCGIYSILNAYKTVYKTTQDDNQKVFEEMIDFLHRKRLLKNVIINGMLFKHLNLVMENVGKKYIPNTFLYWRSYPNPKTKDFWKSVQNHLSENNTCVILSMTGRQDHYTVGVSATDRSIKLFDSGGMKILRYMDCTTTILDENKYILYPAQTYFIGGR